MADLKISELPVLKGTDLRDIDALPLADKSASETRQINTKAFIESGVSTVIDNGVIPGSKLVTDSVTATQIAPNAITSSELADGAVDAGSLEDGSVTDDKVASGIDGAKLQDDSVTGSKIDGAAVDRGLDKTGNKIGITNAITAGSRNGITYDAQGLITATGSIPTSDLPIATVSTIGCVRPPTKGGLEVTAAGELSIGNTVTAATNCKISFDKHGLVTAGADLAPEDLPVATSSEVGAVSVPGTDALTVAANGQLTMSNSGVAAGTYPKVTVDIKGIVTAGSSLVAADIPNLDADQITSGTFDGTLIADNTILARMMADNSTGLIQEADPGTNTNYHTGMLWFQESTAVLSIWNGNSWMAVGIGRLSQENLRYCGTINADTGVITGITSFGASADYSIGDSLRAATDVQTGVYFVVDEAGSGITEVPGVNFDAGDWVLCNGQAAGWVRIDTLNGGGGGGGATNLGDLLDVTISGAAEGDLLTYNASAQWVNVDVIDGGTF